MAFGIFDWGSQSIAQSKFQRTDPKKGKDFQEDIWIFRRQYFFGIFRKSAEKNIQFLAFSITPLRFALETAAEGSAENANRVFLIKIFLLNVLNGIANKRTIIIYAFLFSSRLPS